MRVRTRGDAYPPTESASYWQRPAKIQSASLPLPRELLTLPLPPLFSEFIRWRKSNFVSGHTRFEMVFERCSKLFEICNDKGVGSS